MVPSSAGVCALMSATSWCFCPKDMKVQRASLATFSMPSTSAYQRPETSGSRTYSATWVRCTRGVGSFCPGASGGIAVGGVMGSPLSLGGLRVRHQRRLHRRPGHGGDLGKRAPLLLPAQAAVARAEEVAVLGAGVDQRRVGLVAADRPEGGVGCASPAASRSSGSRGRWSDTCASWCRACRRRWPSAASSVDSGSGITVRV